MLIVSIIGYAKKDYEYYSKKVPKLESQKELNKVLDEIDSNKNLNFTAKAKIMELVLKRKAEITEKGLK